MQPPCPQSGRRNGALHALWRAAPRRERRGAREKRFDQDRRTIHGWHHEGGGASSELPERARMDTSFPARVAVACVAWDGTRPADTESSSRSGWPAPKCDYRTEARLSDEVQSPQGPLESPFFSRPGGLTLRESDDRRASVHGPTMSTDQPTLGRKRLFRKKMLLLLLLLRPATAAAALAPWRAVAWQGCDVFAWPS